ncbi:MAG: hypothetical protein ACYDBJ_01495 [Aggregatilineales bacterium]
MDSNFSDFLHQIPIGFLLAPAIFGGLYIAVMVIIFRRAAARRRARALAMGGSPAVQTRAPNDNNKPLSFFPGLSRTRPVASALHNLPEPDLESLSSTTSLFAAPDMSYSPVNAPMPTANWLAMTPSSADVATESALEPINSEGKELSMEPSTLSDPTGAVEVMRVWRDLSDGTLIIELDGRRFRAPREIGSAELARRFINVVRELWAMVNTGMSSRAPDPVATADLAPGNAGAMASSRGRSNLLNNPPPPLPEPDFKAPGMLRTLGRTVAGQPEKRPAGIADAVEDYLQFKLSNTPQFQQRSIHIRPAFDGGVRIEVDGRSYNGVGDVIDPDVRDFLSATLREWEARQ